MHFGLELYRRPVPYQLRISKHLTSLGVQVIIGAHPHVLQPHCLHDNKLVAYSLGNFLFYPVQPFSAVEPVMCYHLHVTFSILFKKVTFKHDHHVTWHGKYGWDLKILKPMNRKKMSKHLRELVKTNLFEEDPPCLGQGGYRRTLPTKFYWL